MKRRTPPFYIPNVPVPDTRHDAIRRRVVREVLYVHRSGDLRKRTVGFTDEAIAALTRIASSGGSWRHGRDWPKLVRLAVDMLIEAHEGTS